MNDAHEVIIYEPIFHFRPHAPENGKHYDPYPIAKVSTSKLANIRTKDIEKAICDPIPFFDSMIDKFWVVQTDPDILLDENIPEFVMSKKPDLEVTTTLNLVHNMVLSDLEMEVIKHVDIYLRECTDSAKDINFLTKNVFILPHLVLLEDLSIEEHIKSILQKLSKTIQTNNDDLSMWDVIDQMSLKLHGCNIDDIHQTLKICTKCDEDRCHRALQQAELLESKLRGTLVMNIHNVPYLIECIDYSRDPIHLHCNYIHRNENLLKMWSKRKTSSVRYWMEQKVAANANDSHAAKRMEGISIPVAHARPCIYKVDFCTHIIQQIKLIQHVQDQINHYRLLQKSLEGVVSFKNKLLLRTALTHAMYMEQVQKKNSNNEKLEFLGDAVVQLAVSEVIYEIIHEMGELSAHSSWDNITRYLVSNKHLHQVALNLRLHDLLLYSKKREEIVRSKILEDTFEALVGALFLDQGYEAARDLVRKYCIPNCHEEWVNILHKFPVTANEAVVGIDNKNNMDDNTSLSNLYDLESRIGYHFQDISLLRKALKCNPLEVQDKWRLISNESILNDNCNERLRLLGIGILKLVSSEHLFLSYPYAKEGRLTLSVHAILNRDEVCMIHSVNALELSRYATVIGNSRCIQRQDLGSCLQAIIGAVYLDSGRKLIINKVPIKELDTATYIRPYQGLRHDISNNVIYRLFLQTFDETKRLDPLCISVPPKSALQNITQVLFGKIPKYTAIFRDNAWTCTITINDDVIGEAVGSNPSEDLKSVENRAAQQAISLCKGDKMHCNDETFKK